MELCLEAACKLAVVERRQGRSSHIQPSTKEIIGPLPSFAESHGCKPVDECEVGTLRSLGEGGYASEGSALRSVWRGATAARPWGSTVLCLRLSKLAPRATECLCVSLDYK